MGNKSVKDFCANSFERTISDWPRTRRLGLMTRSEISLSRTRFSSMLLTKLYWSFLLQNIKINWKDQSRWDPKTFNWIPNNLAR